jgi:hypothetical protein
MGIFKLYKGWHYSQGGETHDLQNQKLEFRFKFDNSIIYKDSSNCSDMGGYMLWPYFGGNETAPHEITIEMEYKK